MKVAILVLLAYVAYTSAIPAQQTTKAIDWEAIKVEIQGMKDTVKNTAEKVKQLALESSEEIGAAMGEIIDKAVEDLKVIVDELEQHLREGTLSPKIAKELVMRAYKVMNNAYKQLEPLVEQLQDVAEEVQAIIHEGGLKFSQHFLQIIRLLSSF